MSHKIAWKALYSAFRFASNQGENPDVAAVKAVALAVTAGFADAGFALRHAQKLESVRVSAHAPARAISRELESELAAARERSATTPLPIVNSIPELIRLVNSLKAA
jgi:hypothetical protein